MHNRIQEAGIAILFAAGVSSCFRYEPEAPPVPAPPPVEEAVVTTEVVNEAVTAPVEVDADEPIDEDEHVPQRPEPPSTAGKLSALVDTAWRAQDFVFQFKPGRHLIVRGGHFDEVSTAGVPGRVTNDGGVLILEILGRISYGTWDGTTLTIDGVTASPEMEGDDV